MVGVLNSCAEAMSEPVAWRTFAMTIPTCGNTRP